MMVRTEPAYRPTPRHAAIFAGALIAVGLGVCAAASQAQDSPPMLDFLARVQSDADAHRGARLLDAIEPSFPRARAQVPSVAKPGTNV